jgi:hypothetical protein
MYLQQALLGMGREKREEGGGRGERGGERGGRRGGRREDWRGKKRIGRKLAGERELSSK